MLAGGIIKLKLQALFRGGSQKGSMVRRYAVERTNNEK